MRALAHIGVHIHTQHTYGLSSFLASLPGKKFSVDIDIKEIRYYSGIFVFALFYKCW